MISPGQRVAVACSGGPDSTALLLLLHELSERLGCTLSVAHVNHRLRAEQSDADEQFVQRLAEWLQLPSYVQQIDVRPRAKQARANLEEKARELRYEFLLSLIKAGQADRLALGHTADDQAETVLFRLLRGAGTRGLAGIYPVVADKIIRPLLEVRRQAVLDWLQEHQQLWQEDSTNQDLRYTRNRIRHQLLPSLAEFNPRIVETLAETATLARDEEAFWREYLQPILTRALHTEPGKVLVDIPSLHGMPAAVARRVLRYAIGKAAQLSPPEPPEKTERTEFPGRESASLADFGQIQQLLALALVGQSGATLFLPRKIKARKEFRHLILQAEELPRELQGFYCQFQVPALVEVPVLSTLFTFEFVPLVLGQARYNQEGYNLLDRGVAKNPLVLRNWHPGDAYQPKGHRRRRKLKELFQRDRIPVRERECWPVIVAEDQIVWARKWGVAVSFSPAARSTEAVLIQETEPRGGRGEDRSG